MQRWPWCNHPWKTGTFICRCLFIPCWHAWLTELANTSSNADVYCSDCPPPMAVPDCGYCYFTMPSKFCWGPGQQLNSWRWLLNWNVEVRWYSWAHCVGAWRINANLRCNCSKVPLARSLWLTWPHLLLISVIVPCSDCQMTWNASVQWHGRKGQMLWKLYSLSAAILGEEPWKSLQPIIDFCVHAGKQKNKWAERKVQSPWLIPLLS